MVDLLELARHGDGPAIVSEGPTLVLFAPERRRRHGRREPPFGVGAVRRLHLSPGGVGPHLDDSGTDDQQRDGGNRTEDESALVHGEAIGAVTRRE
ncbi:MAG: hypothetical protein KDC98_09015 [Planctomycetes bacterium]|nr:hypothetical protein [Planctomycetota bacterium]